MKRNSIIVAPGMEHVLQPTYVLLPLAAISTRWPIRKSRKFLLQRERKRRERLFVLLYKKVT